MKDKEQQKSIVWNQIRNKKQEIKNTEEKLNKLNNELKELTNKYSVLCSKEDLDIILNL